MSSTKQEDIIQQFSCSANYANVILYRVGILISFFYEESKQNERNEGMKEWNANGSRKARGNESEQWLRIMLLTKQLWQISWCLKADTIWMKADRLWEPTWWWKSWNKEKPSFFLFLSLPPHIDKKFIRLNCNLCIYDCSMQYFYLHKN